MKVQDLQDQLSKLDATLDILCYTEDSELLAPDHLFRLLEIDYVDTIEAQKVRGDDDVASFKLGKSELSEKHAVINVIADF